MGRGPDEPVGDFEGADLDGSQKGRDVGERGHPIIPFIPLKDISNLKITHILLYSNYGCNGAGPLIVR
jgi:hypothetical protein